MKFHWFQPVDLNQLYQEQEGMTSLDILCNRICDEANEFHTRDDNKLVSLIDAFNTIVSYGYTEMGNYRFYCNWWHAADLF